MTKKPRQTVSYVLETSNGPDEGHRLGVNGLALDMERSMLYSGGRDGRLCAWNFNLPQTGKPSVVDTPSSSSLSSLGQTTTHSTTLRRQIRPHIQGINDVILTLDGAALVSASTDLNVKLWLPNSNSQKEAHTLGQHTDYVQRLATPPSGAPGANQWIASGGLDRKIHLWDLHGKGSILELDVAADGVREKGSVYALDAGNNVIASGGPGHIVTLWDPRTGAKINNLIGHTDLIRAVLVGATGETLISASTDRTVKVWSARNYKCIKTLTMHNDSVWSLYSADPSLGTFWSGDRSGLVAKTLLGGPEARVMEDYSVAVAHEHAPVNDIVASGGHVWSATTRSWINRWEDLGDRFDRPSSRRNRRVMPRVDEGAALYGSRVPVPIRSPTAPVLNTSQPIQNPAGVAGITPLRRFPAETVEGANGVVRFCWLKDRRNVLTMDTAGEVAMWDIIQCRLVERFGRGSIEEVLAKVDTQQVTTESWCTIDVSSGSLVVTLNPNSCFDAEMYLDEFKPAQSPAGEFKEDQRVNLGKWVLRYLFSNFVDVQVRRDQEYRANLFSDMGGVTAKPSLPLIQIPATATPGSEADSAATPRASNGAKYTPLSPSPVAIGGGGSPSTAGLPNILEGDAGPASPRASSTSNQPSLAASGSVAAAAPRASTEGLTQLPGPAIPLTSGIEAEKGASGDEGQRVKDGADKDAEKTPSTPFSKFFPRPRPFSRRRSPSTASEKRAVVADPAPESRPEEEKAGGSEVSEPERESTFMSVVRRIRAEYDGQAREYPYKRVETRLTPSTPADMPALRIPPDVKIVVREETASAVRNVYEGTVGRLGQKSEADAAEGTLAAWLAELLLQNLPASPNKDCEEKKVAFRLLPLPASGLPVLAGPDGRARTESSPLSAYRLLRVRKILSYVADRLGGMVLESVQGAVEGQSPRAAATLQPEEYLELHCNGQVLESPTTLAHVKRFAWAGPGEIEFYFGVSDRWKYAFPEEDKVEKVAEERSGPDDEAAHVTDVAPQE